MLVELDLLSRKRNLHNDIVQEELFGIFRKYGINAVALGMGTNRYGFKLNSYAIKFATNEDGRIDNHTEFEMSPKLQPHVVRVHEITMNDVLLVTEYIQPFDTFGEMLQYEDQILEILKELSSMYLIGDIGISENNFGNWGVRPGTTKPVCLDFAYIYDASSSVFLCQDDTSCRRAGIMLRPTKDYFQLVCPGCGKTKLFEELLAGKESIIRKTGDLAEAGYVLERSGEVHTLDTSRSPYLIRQLKSKNKKKQATPVKTIPQEIEDDFMVVKRKEKLPNGRKTYAKL